MPDRTDIEQAAKRRWYTDTYLWIGMFLLCGSLGVYLWNRAPGSSAQDSDAAVEGGQMLNIKWRQRGSVDRPSPTPGTGASSVIEGLEAAPPDSAEVKELLSLVDPAEAGWDTEEMNEAALAKLKKIGGALKLDLRARGSLLAPLLADDFVCTPLQPMRLDQIHRGERYVVERGEGDGAARVVDVDGFGSLLDEMLGGGEGRLSFKIVRVERLNEGYRTRVLFEALVKGADGAKQVNASWWVTWRGGQMTQIRLEGYEQVRQLGDPKPLFADVTAAAFDGVESFSEQFLQDNAHWAKRLVVLEGTSYIGHLGIAVGDINGDGLDDLYVTDGGGLPNRMYVQAGDGSLLDVSTESGTDWLEYTPSALLIDLDNDGDRDLVAATVQLMLFMENDGKGKFTLAGARAGVPQARTMCAADYDLDGDLDLYVCNYALPNVARGFGSPGVVSSFPLPYNDAENGGPNMLLENRGRFRFDDATAQTGLDQNNSRYSLSASWGDYDNDGDPDLYVANDFGRNNLYRNEGGRFTDVAGQAGVEDIASGMSVAWGDYDRDGMADLYVGNMFSSAGGRVAFQREFSDGRGGSDLDSFRRMARGNSLFRAGGGGTFTDVSEEAGVTMGRWAWSSSFADINNDGWLDLVVGNGFVTGRRTDDL